MGTFTDNIRIRLLHDCPVPKGGEDGETRLPLHTPSSGQEAMQAASRLPVLNLSNVIKRDRNRVANELAHLAKRLNHSAVWRSRFSACVEQLILLVIVTLP